LDLGFPHPRRNGAHRCQRDLVLKRKHVFGRQRWRSTGLDELPAGASGSLLDDRQAIPLMKRRGRGQHPFQRCGS
jgi:hypothetical protein